jgi:hypothetical protein
MPKSALYRVDTLTCFFETRNQLRNIVRIPVSQTKLTILVFFTDSIYQTLMAYEEAEIETT